MAPVSKVETPRVARAAESDGTAVQTAVRGALQNVLKAYPELQGASFVLKEQHEANYFFSMRMTAADAVRGRPTYVLHYDPSVVERGLPDGALRGVVAHELAHALRYRLDGPRALGDGLLAQVVSSVETRVEHAADFEAIDRGFGPNLAAYRTWLYPQLSDPEVVQEKQRAYFTPEEIVAAARALQEWPALRAQWRASPPRSLADIERDVRAAQSKPTW